MNNPEEAGLSSRRSKEHLTDAERKEAELEEFYAHQQKAMDKRLEMVFRQINGAKSTKAAKNSSRRPATPSAGTSENQEGLKTTIDCREIEECMLKNCKMSAKQVASCSRGPGDLPVKPLDQVPYIEDMIWEVDETGDGMVNLDEFKKCYNRAAADKTGFEPRKLTTLVDFLLMDEENLGFVTQDQIVELMTARYGAWRCPCISAAYRTLMSAANPVHSCGLPFRIFSG